MIIHTAAGPSNRITIGHGSTVDGNACVTARVRPGSHVAQANARIMSVKVVKFGRVFTVAS